MLFNEEHVFRKFKQKIKRLRNEYDLKNLVQYFIQKIKFNNFVYIEKVLQQEKNFNSKN